MHADNLRIALSAAVPLCIVAAQARGGPKDVDWQIVQETGDLLGAKADLLMFLGEKFGETARVFNALAASLAILAFCPGGVTFLGEHWEVQYDGKVQKETSDNRS